MQLVICKFQINDETNNDVAKIYLQRILTPLQLFRNKSDDIKLSLKTFLQEVKKCRCSINCEGIKIRLLPLAKNKLRGVKSPYK